MRYADLVADWVASKAVQEKQDQRKMGEPTLANVCSTSQFCFRWFSLQVGIHRLNNLDCP